MADFPTISDSESDSDHEDRVVSKRKSKSGGFQSMGLSKSVFGGVMRMGYRVPSPIQRKVIPIAMMGRDVVAMARTGSGKTAAFLIPLLERLVSHSTKVGVRGIILSPTRELAQQTMNFLIKLGKLTDLRGSLIIGGHNIENQFEALASNPDILVSTPGRLLHLLMEVTEFTLDLAEVIIFDEADRLFEMGFKAQLHDIMQRMPPARQTMLFSATLPRILIEFTRAGLRDPEFVRLDVESKVSPNLRLAFFAVRSEEKSAVLLYVCRQLIAKNKQTIIFTATRHHVEYIAGVLGAFGLPALPVYGTLDMDARQDNVAAFRAGKCQFLVVTDVAARGIDIPLLDVVINYDFPPKPKVFVHRVGRVARQNRSGVAISITCPDEVPYMVDMYDFLGLPLSPEELQKQQKDDFEPYSMDTIQPDQVHYGRLPRKIVDPEIESISRLEKDSMDIARMRRSMRNAHKLFLRTKAPASKGSFAIAKEIAPHVVMHPFFVSDDPSDQAAIVDKKVEEFRNAISKYRPGMTIFEHKRTTKAGYKDEKAALGAELSKAMRKQVKQIARFKNIPSVHEEPATTVEEPEQQQVEAAPAAPSSAVGADARPRRPTTKKRLSKAERNRQKRLAKAGRSGISTSSTKAPTQKKKKKVSADDFKDSKFYLTQTREGARGEEHLMVHAQEMEDAELDLGEGAVEINKARKTYTWNASKKKYIQSNEHERALKIKLDSGVILSDADKGKMYERWQKRHHRTLATVGSTEAPSAARGIKQFHQGKRKREVAFSNMADTAGEGNQKGGGGGHKGVRSELRDASAIRKMRKDADDKLAKQRAIEASRKAKAAGRRGARGPRNSAPKKQIINKNWGSKKGKGGRGKKKK